MPNDKRRVLILSEIISPYRIPVFNALAEDGRLELHVVFLSETDSGLRQWRVYKDEIRFSHEVLPSTRFRAGRSSLLLNWKLRSCLGRFEPEVIICGGYNYVASWGALWWTKKNGAELVLWCESNRYDARSGRGLVESLKSYFVSHCDRFVVPGQASREYLRVMGVEDHTISIAPNAVDNEWFRTRAESIRAQSAEFRARFSLPERFLLFVGRLVAEKGVFDLLAAYNRLPEELRASTGLIFAGDGPDKTQLERQARLTTPGAICFPGFLHREELAGLYALAAALVLPTRSDPWGLVVNEAMACGLPIVVSDVAGCACDLVENGWNGYVVPPRDVPKLTAAIELLMQNQQLAKKMGERSVERIRGYSPEACAEGLAAAALTQTSEVQWMTG